MVVGAVAAIASVSGAVVGTLTGLMLILRHPGQGTLVEALTLSIVTGVVGAVFGGMTGTLLAFTLMRHVPLSRAASETALAASASVSVQVLLGVDSGWFYLWPVVAAAGAALRLRIVFPIAGRRQTILPPPANNGW